MSMKMRLSRFFALFFLVFAGLTFAAPPAAAAMLVELFLNADSRPYAPENPPAAVRQQFSVPGGEGRLVMTYVEEGYVGGPGGFSLDPVDLSNEYLGWGGSTAYTPRDPLRGQPYRVETIWRHSFSKKMWVATLVARHVYQAMQITGHGQQVASRQKLTVEFIPSSPPTDPAAPVSPAATLTGLWEWGAGGGVVEILADGTGRDSRGNSMRWTIIDAAKGIYELRWSHGYTDAATLSADGASISVVNNAGTRFVATRRAAQASSLVGSWDWGAGGGIVEIHADGTGKDSRGNTMLWTLIDAAKGAYELRWSHGFVDRAILSPDGKTVAIVNNAGTGFVATRRS